MLRECPPRVTVTYVLRDVTYCCTAMRQFGRRELIAAVHSI